MLKGKQKTIIPVLAMIVLLIGISSTLYVNASTVDKETITINNLEYTIDELFSMVSIRTIELEEEKISGIALDELIIKTGINCQTCSKYTFKAKDNYQQTVNWENMKKGILTEEARVIFPDTAHALWVRDVVTIEVN